MNVVITESLQRTQGQLTPCLISMSLVQADCHKNRIVTKTQEAQEHKDEQSSNRPASPRKVPLPSESTTEPFGCHNIFRKAVFPLWPIVIFVTCHNSLPPPPPRAPTPTPEWRTNWIHPWHAQAPPQTIHKSPSTKSEKVHIVPRAPSASTTSAWEGNQQAKKRAALKARLHAERMPGAATVGKA